MCRSRSRSEDDGEDHLETATRTEPEAGRAEVAVHCYCGDWYLSSGKARQSERPSWILTLPLTLSEWYS